MRQRDPESGFTLIELLVVIALIALVSAFALPSVNSFFKLSLNTATREIAANVKESYNATLMTGKVHRIVFDLKEQKYWVEIGPAGVLMETAETLEKQARRKRLGLKVEESSDSAFQMDRSITKKKLTLPRGVEFEDVITEQSLEPITTGIAYAHSFPSGLMEKAIIHLKDSSKNQVTLLVTPLLGRTKFVPGYVKNFEEADRALKE
jgi:prepilin-type N-terminal cleavage/methylation domain-containing protein